MNPSFCASSAVFQTFRTDCDSKSLSFDQIPSIVKAKPTAMKGTSFDPFFQLYSLLDYNDSTSVTQVLF